MSDNLVIVESPAKAKTIEKFLGEDFKVMSSYGHIRDLKRKELSIDADTMEPIYEIPSDKTKVVHDLREAARKAKQVWLASDEDREGEAISWHLSEVLGLDPQTTPRIVFHEITKNAILHAIENPRHIDMNLVNAQQARRVLDRLVGFKISPVLWRKVKPSLSAGRVQSVAVKLIVEREREIQNFKSEPFYRIAAVFETKDEQGQPVELKAEMDCRFHSHDEAMALLESCRDATFEITAVQKKPIKRMPAPPFTTSTLQQEASRKLGFTVSQTMMVAQRLYESGHITYMRTDSVNLSSLAIGMSKQAITELYGLEYSDPRNFHVNTKGAQEAHEAIRPTYITHAQIDGTAQERRLYELIWKRTVASQMAEAEMEKTTMEISIKNGVSQRSEHFVAQGEVVVFDGFLKVYNESNDDASDAATDDNEATLPALKTGTKLAYKEITSTERFTQAPFRYNEASLVHKMEELGIGRPSTYAPTISTIQQREYVERGDVKGTERQYVVDTLRGGKLSMKTKKEVAGHEKSRLMPTDIGVVVNDFLQENFPDIMDYNFTAHVEQDFDSIADGKEEWEGMIHQFDNKLNPAVEKVKNQHLEHKAGERELGVDPKSGRTVSVKIGRFGPVVQIGKAGEDERPRFAQVPKDKSIETITLDEALELFRLPRNLGKFEGTDVVIGTGKFGPYVLHEKAYTSIPKEMDPLTITLDEAVQLINDKREQERKRHLRTFNEDAEMEIMQGRFGPYIAYAGKNYRMPKTLHEKVNTLTYEECLKIVEQAKARKKE